MTWLSQGLITAGSDGWVRLWEPLSPGPFARPLPPAYRYSVWQDQLLGWSETELTIISDKNVSKIPYDAVKLETATGNAALATSDKAVFLLNFGHDQKIKTFPFPKPPTAHYPREFSLNANGNKAAIAWWPNDFSLNEPKISIWSPLEDEIVWIDQLTFAPYGVALSQDDKMAVSGGSGELVIYDARTAVTLHGGAIIGDNAPFYSLAFDGEDRLCSGNLQGFVACFDLGTTITEVVRTNIPVGSVTKVEILPDHSLVTLDVDGVRWFDEDLQYRGLLLSTQRRNNMGRAIASQNELNRIIVPMQDGTAVSVSLDPLEWAKEAENRARH